MKRAISIIYAIVICLPCILALSCGPEAPQGNETVGWTNLIGLAWMAFMAFGGFRMITPKWMRRELSALLPEDED